MKLSFAVLTLALLSEQHATGFIAHQQPQRIRAFGGTATTATTTELLATTTRNSSTQQKVSSSSSSSFSSFEESLEDETFAQSQPWQQKLEDLLDPTTSLAQRQILLSELLGANQEIRDSVLEALQNRKIDPLLTPNAKRLQDGTRAVARQLTDDILPTLAESVQSGKVMNDVANSVLPTPENLSKLTSRVLNAMQSQAKRAVEEVQQDLANPSRIAQKVTSEWPEELAKEARNVFSEVPEGLVGPPYQVVSCQSTEYEIRDYEGYTVASTNMNAVGEPYDNNDLRGSGTAFNVLAAYLFGANQDGSTMEMTTPVTTTSLGEMRFFLKPNRNTVVSSSSSSFPMPLTDDSMYETGAVQILDIPPTRLAVRKFTGFVTEGEVNRQKEVLLEQLELDGEYVVDVPHGQKVPHVIFQYNPPYTVPIVRRNEIAVPIRLITESPPSLEQEWRAVSANGSGGSNNSEDMGDDISPSDVE